MSDVGMLYLGLGIAFFGYCVGMGLSKIGDAITYAAGGHP